MTKGKWAIAAALFVVLCVGVMAIAFAKAPGGANGGKAGAGRGLAADMLGGGDMGRLAMMAERLLNDPEFQKAVGLSDIQLSQLKAKLGENKKTMTATRDSMKNARQDLKTLLDADNPDLAKIDAKIDDLSRLQAQSMKQMARMQVDVKNIMSKEQIAKAKEYIKGKLAQNRGGKGNRGVAPRGQAPENHPAPGSIAQ